MNYKICHSAADLGTNLIGPNLMLPGSTALINFSWNLMYESCTHKTLSILITVQVCKTVLKSGFDFLVRSVYILALYFRQTVCKEIQERADGKMGDVASIF